MKQENLEGLLDALTETSVYVIEEATHRLLYFNRRCRELGRGRAALGARCHEVWPEVCANCPLDTLGDGPSSHIVCYDPLLGTTVDVMADRITWDGSIPAVAVTAAPHRLNYEEEQGLERIEKMYTQGLVTVFQECVIANLTADFYVNCQRDALWTEIPKEGNFGAENLRYARITIHPDDLPQFESHFTREAMLRRFGEGQKQISRRMRRRVEDGTYHMVEFTATQIEDLVEGECWCVLVYRDVQEAYLAERRKNVEISQLATAARTAYQMLIAVNLTQNQYRIIGYEQLRSPRIPENGCFDEMIDDRASTVEPESREEFRRRFSREALLEAFGRGERVVTLEMRQVGEDGAYHWVSTQVVRVDSPDTDDVLEITMAQNIDAERRRQEENLRRERESKDLLAEALDRAEAASQAKSNFLSRMSHDIRTPMNAIVGLTALAKLHLGDEERLRDYLRKIEGSSAHLLGLINEVLDVSKIESGTARLEEQEFDLRDMVQDTVMLVQPSIQAKDQRLEVALSEKLHGAVTGDEVRLRQVLVNLMDNASKYTLSSGLVRLRVEELRQAAAARMGTYRFTVEDSGIGMEPEFLQHIFEPFTRAEDAQLSKVAGTGLGMTIVRNVVELMGGDIRVESERGRGSRFTVTLCLSQREDPGRRQTGGQDWETEDFHGVRALLAEDNALNQQIAAELLGLMGLEVEVAENGRLAAEAVLRHPPEYYDVVFMDIQMPEMNGYEATRAIRSSGAPGMDRLPIIAMTADAFAEDVRQAQVSGMNGHLAKPIAIDRLRSTLAACLRRRDGDGA